MYRADKAAAYRAHILLNSYKDALGTLVVDGAIFQNLPTTFHMTAVPVFFLTARDDRLSLLNH